MGLRAAPKGRWGKRAGRSPIAQDCSSKGGVKRRGPVVALDTMTGSTSAFKSNRRVPDTQQSLLQTLGNVYIDQRGNLPNCHLWMGAK